MTTVGIIAEYNPFHNGHAHQIRCLREKHDDVRIIAVMSGSFTQRGECAILTKWQRAESAVRNGVDLVVELPASYAVRSAQDFANGGVKLLNAMGVVDLLAFGAKNTDVDVLTTAATYADSDETQRQLHQEIQQGISYGAALRRIMSQSPILCSHHDLLDDPNTLLALEYIRALKRTGSTIHPLPIQRTGAHHNSLEISSSIASGTAIRTILAKSSNNISEIETTVPKSTYDNLRRSKFPHMEYLFRLLLNKIHDASYSYISSIFGINEGLENRLMDAASKAASLEEFISLVSTKRYSHSRIRRIIFHLLCAINKETIQLVDDTSPQYIRVLSFNERGRTILRELKTATPLPVITKFSDYFTTYDLHSDRKLSPLKQQLRLDVLSTDLQGLCIEPPTLGRDFTTSPIFVK